MYLFTYEDLSIDVGTRDAHIEFARMECLSLTIRSKNDREYLTCICKKSSLLWSKVYPLYIVL